MLGSPVLRNPASQEVSGPKLREAGFYGHVNWIRQHHDIRGLIQGEIVTNVPGSTLVVT